MEHMQQVVGTEEQLIRLVAGFEVPLRQCHYRLQRKKGSFGHLLLLRDHYGYVVVAMKFTH